MKKIRITGAVLLVCAIIICALCPTALAAEGAELAADKLAVLGLVQGTENGYELDASSTRVQAITMVVRLAGGEGEALSGSFSHPFTDVPDWARGYVGYAYERGLTDGVSATLFGSGNVISARDYMTFMLRALGYVSGRDFTWERAVEFGFGLGLGDMSYTGFLRGDMFSLTLDALAAEKVGTGETLAAALAGAGTLSPVSVSALGLSGRAKLTARNAWDRYGSAVFCILAYSTQSDYDRDSYTSTASGFFISADGVAVTNYHTIKTASFARAVTLDGASYDISRVLWYDTYADIAVVRLSSVSVSGTPAPSFSYFSMVPSENVFAGDTVYALGYPLGLTHIISSGIVGDRAYNDSQFRLPLIVNSAPISKGSSGGVLVNVYGDAVGITSAYYTNGQSLYMAVPLDTVLTADLSGPGQTLQQVKQAEGG